MAGEAADQIWSTFIREKGTAYKRIFMEVPPDWTHCPVYGCNRCDHEDCIYGEFIRHYWHHPRCD